MACLFWELCVSQLDDFSRSLSEDLGCLISVFVLDSVHWLHKTQPLNKEAAIKNNVEAYIFESFVL